MPAADGKPAFRIPTRHWVVGDNTPVAAIDKSLVATNQTVEL